MVHDAGVDRAGQGADGSIAQHVVDEIESSGGQAVAATQNLSTNAACTELIEQAFERYGRIDALIHSAGIVAYKGIENTTDAEWTTLRSVNIDAPFWLCRAVWPIMRQQQYGRIVLTVSGYGLKSFEGSDVTAYGVGQFVRLSDVTVGSAATPEEVMQALPPPEKHN